MSGWNLARPGIEACLQKHSTSRASSAGGSRETAMVRLSHVLLCVHGAAGRMPDHNGQLETVSTHLSALGCSTGAPVASTPTPFMRRANNHHCP